MDAGEVNRKLVQCAQDCISRLLRALDARNQDRSARLVKQFQYLELKINRACSNEDELVEREAAVEAAIKHGLAPAAGGLRGHQGVGLPHVRPRSPP